jgi:hypothetical protein
MENRFQGNRNPLTVRDYLELGSPRTNAHWIGNMIGLDSLGNGIIRFPLDICEGIFRVSQTDTHFCHIDSSTEWLSFINSCYSLGCRNCDNEGWKAINGVKLRFREWMASPDIMRNPNYTVFEEQRHSDSIFITVFDTRKQKRLMVDGLHRASALTVACDGGRVTIPRLTILECFGDRVDMIFPCDIHQLPS